MLFDPIQIRAMRNALLTAEHAMLVTHPHGIDLATRNALAKEVVAAFTSGMTNPLVISSIAIRTLNVRSAACCLSGIGHALRPHC